MLTYICQHCGREFQDRKRPDRVVKYCSHYCCGQKKLGKSSWNKGIPCREETKEKLSKALIGRRCSIKTEFTSENSLGDKNKHWGGGRYKKKPGYIVILLPGHPQADSRGYVYEHILVAEEKLGRPIKSGEVVHHINRIRDDNRPENLIVFPSLVEHLRQHRIEDSN